MHNDQLITHRCKGSLDARVSIQFCCPYKTMTRMSQIKAWWIFVVRPDVEDWGSYIVSPVTPIYYCPYCGRALEIPDEET